MLSTVTRKVIVTDPWGGSLRRLRLNAEPPAWAFSKALEERWPWKLCLLKISILSLKEVPTLFQLVLAADTKPESTTANPCPSSSIISTWSSSPDSCSSVSSTPLSPCQWLLSTWQSDLGASLCLLYLKLISQQVLVVSEKITLICWLKPFETYLR